ncbi:Indigoidine synthase A like protein-domain-containing protein [Fimicolochytrium jonesii]|uniref:Indigoidine synthase A like protein-domain-containing protein n=1 Tax=Fimicolochytrium jonesii TaxID=1396493 RepID=UPI0022FE94CC|nr:Indigoidine synthase A like protein-domain-containing protein [Fimicolochytrium jonesii]KAI8820469.1 Indigoidine synthase A like protein-domain-containing protein [Fimicolochytrium jonesii]
MTSLRAPGARAIVACLARGIFVQPRLALHSQKRWKGSKKGSGGPGTSRWNPPAFFDFHPSVLHALQHKLPVVALESTIISHGMPYPQNLETAQAVEQIVRDEGCIPASICLMDGRVKVGLTAAELEKLAKTGLAARKTSRRDLAVVLAQGVVGATTVSGTMAIAHMAQIKVFVTGGIGGVHRGGEESLDVSADLTELGRTPVAVICAGAKSILDIPRTLEYLETQGVTVATYGESDEFPAFYTPKSGVKSMCNVQTPEEAARIIGANSQLKLTSGVVIAVPIPEADAPKDAGKIEEAVVDAVEEAKVKGIRGKDITPFLLDRVKQITGGDSLTANIALVKNNARIGSRIAAAYAARRKPPANPKTGNKNENDQRNPIVSAEPSPSSTQEEVADSARSLSGETQSSGKRKGSPPKGPRPFVIGGSVLDISARFGGATNADGTPVFGESHPGKCVQSLGGVGRNVAEACHRTGGNPLLLSCVGRDVAGDGLIQEMAAVGMDVNGIRRLGGHSTAIYNAFLKEDGGLLGAVADMEIHNQIHGKEVAAKILAERPTIVCIDGNLSAMAMETVLKACTEKQIPVLFEPTSQAKAVKLFEVDLELIKGCVRYATPNSNEFVAMMEKTGGDLRNIIPVILEKRGSEGVHVHHPSKETEIQPMRIVKDCVSVTGAGDSLVGTLLTCLSRYHGNPANKGSFFPSAAELMPWVRNGMHAAELSLGSRHAVSKDLTWDAVYRIASQRSAD